MDSDFEMPNFDMNNMSPDLLEAKLKELKSDLSPEQQEEAERELAKMNDLFERMMKFSSDAKANRTQAQNVFNLEDVKQFDEGLFKEMSEAMGDPTDAVTKQRQAASKAEAGTQGGTQGATKGGNEEETPGPDDTVIDVDGLWGEGGDDAVSAFTKLMDDPQIKQLTDLVNEKPPIDLINNMLSTAASQGNIKEMVRTFRDMGEVNAVPNAKTYRLLIKGFGAAGMFDKMEKAVLKMQSEGHPIDVRVYNLMIKAYGVRGKTDALRKTIALMRSKGIETNERTDTLVARYLPSNTPSASSSSPSKK